LKIDVLSFLRRRSLKLSLILIISSSLVAYLIPLNFSPPITVGTGWTYKYGEVLILRGETVYYYEAYWRYAVTDSEEGVLYLEINETSRVKLRLKNGSWVEGESESQWLSLVNPETRASGYMFFCSWWVPSTLRYGDIVPIWRFKFRVTGLTWMIVGGRILECWRLESIDQPPNEEYVFYYERTTGLFVYFKIRSSYGDYEMITERILVESTIEWPVLTLLRPFFLLTVFGASGLLTAPYLHELVKRLREAKRRFWRKPENLLF